MPTRKPTTDDDPSPTQPTQQIQATEQQLKARAEGVSIEDYLLPRSLTLRLAKSVLPPNTAMQKDAVLALQKAATVFVSYLSSHANEATLKRTILPADVFAALSEIEFDAFRPRLEKELEAFAEMKAGKRRAKKGGVEVGNEVGKAVEDEEGVNVVRGTKRVKRVEGVVQSVDEEEDDDDDTQEEQEQGQENEEGEEDEEDDVEEEEEDEDETQEEDIDRVEDLDRDSRPRRTMDPDAVGDETDSEDDTGPGTQLQQGLGLG